MPSSAGPKALPDFSAKPEPLGAELDLIEARSGSVRIGKKRKRVEDLVLDLKLVISNGSSVVSSHAADCLTLIIYQHLLAPLYPESLVMISEE